MMEEFSWELFCKTGDFETFLLYKEIENSKANRLAAKIQGENFQNIETNRISEEMGVLCGEACN